MIKILWILLLSGCAGTQVYKAEDYKVTTKNFSDHREAKNYIINKRNYLKMLFEQSWDPYYGTPKWSEECLSKHHIGEIQSNYFSSKLILNQSGEPGHCQGTLSEVIYLQCAGSSDVLEIICSSGECPKNIDSIFCSH